MLGLLRLALSRVTLLVEGVAAVALLEETLAAAYDPEAEGPQTIADLPEMATCMKADLGSARQAAADYKRLAEEYRLALGAAERELLRLKGDA